MNIRYYLGNEERIQQGYDFFINKQQLVQIELREELQVKDEDAKFYTELKQQRHNANYLTDIFYDNEKIEEVRIKTIKFLNKVREMLKTIK